MEQESDLLAAFLADPQRPAAASAYLDWLERQGDVRGEYLRLLLGLGEPADAQAAGPERLRLRELRGQVDGKWADAIDRTRLHLDGLYQAAGDGSSSFLRFYAGGVVLTVGSTGTAAKVWKWLTVEKSTYAGRWTLAGDQLSFFSTGKMMDPDAMHPQWSGDLEGWQDVCEQHNAERMRTRTEYTGVVGPETLALRWHSFSNGAEGTANYRFVPIGSE
jgi:hypothetical protein